MIGRRQVEQAALFYEFSLASFLRYALEFEEKLLAVQATSPGAGCLIFCGNGIDWHPSQLEDFADFYRTGEHRPDDSFAEMEADTWRRTTSCCAGISIHSAASPEAIAIFSRAAGSFRYGDRACPGLDAGRRASLDGGLRLLTRSVFGCGVTSSVEVGVDA
jgi:hypothetical protein